MDIRRSLLSLALAATISSAFGVTLGPYAPRFWFATDGDDCYADGTLALNGECYALVWQKDGVPFQGFHATGTYGESTSATLPVDPVNCQVLHVWPAAVKEYWAEEDRMTSYCPDARCTVSRDYYLNHATNGTFSIYLFDTRKLVGGQQVVSGCDEATKTVPILNGYGLVYGLDDIDMVPESDNWKIFGDEEEFDPYGKEEYSYGDWDFEQDVGVNSYSATQSVLPRDAPVPCVSAFSVAGGTATLTVTNAPAYLRCVVLGGETLAALQTTPACVGEAKQGGETLVWTLSASAAQGFFKVDRQAMPKKED